MKKRIISILLILVFVTFYISAYGKYGGITNQYYWGYGWAGAKYCGTTKNLSIDEVHNDRWNSGYYDNSLSTPQSFSGKLSKRQSSLLWYALKQYDYLAGEIYAVNFTDENYLGHHYALSVQIEADGSCTWKGFTFDDL